MAPSRYLFDCACDGLLRDIADACAREWLPYRGDLGTQAYLQARIVMRLARGLKLYPSTARLEADPRPVPVLARKVA